MPIEILMPALSPTMTEGTLARWLKNEGDAVASGDILAEIETDKATMEVEAVDEGRLGRIVVPAGTANVKVNDVIALLLGDDEDAGSLDRPAAAKPTSAVSNGAAAAVVSVASPAPIAAISGGRVFASPLARRLAKDAGVDLADLKGSGPHGRIVKADIEQAKLAPKPSAAPKPAAPMAAGPAPRPVAADAIGTPFDLVPHSSMRRTIARRLTEAARDIPHFYLTADCRLDALLALRSQLNKRGDDLGFKLSVNDFVIRAAALALKRMPDVNSAWSEEGMLRFTAVDVAVAVALPGGLITPIVRDADKKGIAQISAEIRDLVGRAKDGKLKPQEYQGGTFSVSNLGMYGIREFTAIINPPQSCILAVGAGIERAVVKDGAVVVETVMTATLSCDHRVVDGALGAQFMSKFRALVEDPLALLV